MVEKLNFESLEPYMSDEQLYTHYEKHHKTYDKNIKNLLNSNTYDLVYLLDNTEPGSKLWNNAAQVYNHNLFWRSIKPSTYKPGEQEGLIKQIKEKSMSVFGSGWVFITPNHSVIATSNAGLCMNALIAIDVWEHAYYVDHRSDRATFIDTFVYKLMNWELIT